MVGKGDKDNRSPDFEARRKCPVWDKIGPDKKLKGNAGVIHIAGGERMDVTSWEVLEPKEQSK